MHKHYTTLLNSNHYIHSLLFDPTYKILNSFHLGMHQLYIKHPSLQLSIDMQHLK